MRGGERRPERSFGPGPEHAMILGIDTSAAQCAVALLGAPINAGDPVVERRAMERGHAEHLFPMIDSVLGWAGIGYDGLSRTTTMSTSRESRAARFTWLGPA